MSDLPDGWDEYNPNQHERSEEPSYKAARAAAARRAERRRAAYGEALAALRRARSLTQVAVAQRLGVAQGEVSRIEHQGDLLLSTLARYVEGMDGKLALLVRLATAKPSSSVRYSKISLGQSTPKMMWSPRISPTSSSSPDITVATSTRRRSSVPLLPPELAHPLRNPAQRAEARPPCSKRRHFAIDRGTRDQAGYGMVARRASRLPDRDQRSSRSAATARVSRWASLFAEELAEVHRLAAGKAPLSDMELQEVLYLAGRLLSTVTDWPIDRVDDFTVA